MRATIWRAQSRRGESPAATPPTPLFGESVATVAHLGHSPAALITRLRFILLPGLTCPTPSRGAGAEQILALACLTSWFFVFTEARRACTLHTTNRTNDICCGGVGS